MIIPAMMYDSMVLGTDRLDTNVTHVSDTAQTPGDVAALLATVQSALTTISGYVDTEVAAIKAKTDQLTFTKSLELDVNMQSVNNVTLTGAGVLGNEFEP
jgi:hypothetical protein